MSLIIISAFTFLTYLQTGILVFWKNTKSPINRCFFLIAIYLTFLSVLFNGYLFYDVESIHYRMIMWITWSLLPFMLFRFNYLLTGIPKRKKTYNIWFNGLLFVGLFISLFTVSAFISVDIKNIPDLEHLIILQLVWKYLFIGFMLATLGSFTFQYYMWRKEPNWKKERMNFGILFFTFFSVASVDFVLHITMQEFLFTNYLKMPHIFLFPWFLTISLGFVRYRFAAPDPAKAARKVLIDLPQILFFCDQKARLNETNPYSLKIMEKTKKEIRNVYIQDLFSEKNVIQGLINKAIEFEHSGPAITELLSGKDKIIPVEVYCTLLKDRFSDTYGFVLYGRDYRNTIRLKQEIKQRQELEVYLRQKRENLEAEIEYHTKKLRQSLEEAEKKAAITFHTENKIIIELEDMEVMLGEIRTRIINNINIILLMLNHDSFKNLDKTEKNSIDSLIRQIYAIQLVNTQIQSHENYGLVKFEHFLELLVKSYNNSFNKILSVKLSGENHSIWVDQAVPLAIAVNEVLSSLVVFVAEKRRESNYNVLIKFEVMDDSVCRIAFFIKTINKATNRESFTLCKDKMLLAKSLVEEQLGGLITVCSKEASHVSLQVPLHVLRRGHLGINS